MMNIPIISASSFYVPRVSHNRSLPTTQGTPPKNSRYVWPRLLWSHCFVLGPSACEILCAPSKSSLCFSQSYTQSPLAFKAKYSGGSSSQWPDAQTGEPDLALRILTPGGEPL